MEMYSSSVVANAFIKHAKNEGEPLTNMKLQKLVYIAHGYCLAILDTPLIGEDVHAFNWGPVIPRLYKRLKKYGSSEVTSQINTEETLYSEGNAKSIVDEVWGAYKKLSAGRLSTITHKEDTPWEKTWRKSHYSVIDNDLIKEHYKHLLDERETISPANRY